MTTRNLILPSWVTADKKVPDDSWITEGSSFDKTIPFLGENSPKPVGFLARGKDKVPIWHPARPVPALHPRSWDASHPQSLLLCDHQMSKARTLLPEEAFSLLGGRKVENYSLNDMDHGLA